MPYPPGVCARTQEVEGVGPVEVMFSKLFNNALARHFEVRIARIYGFDGFGTPHCVQGEAAGGGAG